MMSFLRIFFFLFVSALSAFSYSSEGHEIIADFAQELIKGTSAESEVKALLGSHSMAGVSTWADKIKGGDSPDPDLNAWRDANRGHPPGETSSRHSLHHYTNPAFQETEYSADLKGTNPDDLVHAMRDCILILQGKEPSGAFEGASQKVALILLIHYAGDLAQPLHVGEGYLGESGAWVNPRDAQTAWGTAGGNRLKWGTANLHHYWDKAVVSGAMRAAGFRGHPSEYARFLVKRSDANRQPPPGEVEDWPAVFAGRMLPKAKKAYEGIRVLRQDGKDWEIVQPSDEYNEMAVTMTDDNLRVGGEQLAEILREIWPD